MKKTCRWQVFSAGRSGYAARRELAKEAARREQARRVMECHLDVNCGVRRSRTIVGARNACPRAALGAAPTRTSQTIERERKSRKQGALFVRTENRLDRVGRQPNRRLHSPVTVRRMQGIPCADEPFPLGFGVQSVCDAGACAQSHPLKPRWRFAFFAATGKEGRRRSGETSRQITI